MSPVASLRTVSNRVPRVNVSLRVAVQRSSKYNDVVLMSILAPRVASVCHTAETPGVKRGIGLPFASSIGLPFCTT